MKERSVDFEVELLPQIRKIVLDTFEAFASKLERKKVQLHSKNAFEVSL